MRRSHVPKYVKIATVYQTFKLFALLNLWYRLSGGKYVKIPET